MAAGAYEALPVAIKRLLWRIDSRSACPADPALAGKTPCRHFGQLKRAWSVMDGGDYRSKP
jgi:hypothetical protein